MASNFTSADVAVTTTRQTVYTAPALTSSIVYSGVVSNTDDTGMSYHLVTLELLHTDGTTYRQIFHKVPVEYGQTLKIPKLSLSAGQSLVVSGDANSALEFQCSIVERS